MKNKNFCTSCAACKNICPVQAIEMKEDEYGFWYPQIDNEKCIKCGACDKVCENLTTYKNNPYQLAFAVQSKDIEINQKSSSGGIFAELAKYVLSQNGIVFGCSMYKENNTFIIKHIAIDNINDLYKLQGSKYVQSEIDDTYKQAKKYLLQDKLVLFSGTPCQIAGLKSFLNKDYENLLCIDLSCEGVPSQKLFNDYVKFLENKYKDIIVDLKFRDKRKFGWSTAGFTAKFQNNKEVILPQNISSYFHTFINGGIYRTSCYNCEYVGLNRVGDITIADCWGFEQEYSNLLKTKFSKNKGVSLVLINSEKGKHIYNLITNNVIDNEVSAELLKHYNGPLREPVKLNEISKQYIEIYKNNGYAALDKQFIKNLGWKYYYFQIKNKTPQFIKNVIKLFIKKEQKLDCVIMTWCYLKNYGAILTGFALKKYINNIGFTCKILKCENDDKYIAAPFNKKYHVYYDKFFFAIKNLKELPKITNTYIVGSDNQINLTLRRKYTYLPLAFFLPQTMKKAIISGSCSCDKIEASEIEVSTMKTLLKRFDYVSVREYNGINLLKDNFDCESDWVIDPVFLLDKQEYFNIMEESSIDTKRKILSYILYPDENKNNIIKYIQNSENKEIVDFTANEQSLKKLKNKLISVEDWLKGIKDADLIVSDSYHCICFAIIFHKPFICLKNSHGFIRFESLFKMFNLHNVLTENTSNIIYNKIEDYSEIDKVISNRREFVKNKLIKIITEPKQITEKQIKAEKELKKIPRKELYARFWYKENKLFYYCVIVLLVKPIKRLLRAIKCIK